MTKLQVSTADFTAGSAKKILSNSFKPDSSLALLFTTTLGFPFSLTVFRDSRAGGHPRLLPWDPSGAEGHPREIPAPRGNDNA